MVKFRIDSDYIKKGLCYGGLTLFFALLQVTLIPRYPIFGVQPDLVLSCVLAASMFEGAKFGSVIGVAAGFFIDAIGSVGLSLSPLIFCVFGYVTGICAEFLFRRGLISFTMSVIVGYFLRGFATIFLVSAVWNDYSTTFVFLRVALPEIALSVVFSYPVYFVFRRLAKKFHQEFELKN